MRLFALIVEKSGSPQEPDSRIPDVAARRETLKPRRVRKKRIGLPMRTTPRRPERLIKSLEDGVSGKKGENRLRRDERQIGSTAERFPRSHVARLSRDPPGSILDGPNQEN